MPIALKRFRISDQGGNLIARLSLRDADKLAQSSEWLEAKIELEPSADQMQLKKLRPAALEKLKTAIEKEIARLEGR